MIKARNHAAFQVAAGGGHLSVLNRLVELAPNWVSRMIKAKNYNAFQVAARGWYWPVLNRLMELAPDLVSLMMAANDYAAFSTLALRRRDGIVNRALCDPGTFAHAEMHQCEYGER